MISKTILAALLLFTFTGMLPSHLYAQTAKHAPADMTIEVLRLVNEHRTNMGLSALKMNPVISKAAAVHTHNMATKKVSFGHDGYDERMNGISKQLKNVTADAENVAYGAKTAKEVVEMWLHSPGHKKNIEGNYNLTGLAIEKGTDGQFYYTQIFVKAGN